jgi:hypothetical protein
VSVNDRAIGDRLSAIGSRDRAICDRLMWRSGDVAIWRSGDLAML